MRHTYRLLDRPAFVRFQLVSSLGVGVRRMTRIVLLALGLAGTAALFAPAGTLDRLISTPLGGEDHLPFAADAGAAHLAGLVPAAPVRRAALAGWLERRCLQSISLSGPAAAGSLLSG